MNLGAILKCLRLLGGDPTIHHGFPNGVIKRHDVDISTPHRNPMSPPDLAADAPVLEAGHPVIVNFGPAVGMEFHLAVSDDVLGCFDAWVFEEPLFAEAALNGHVGALGVAEVVLIRLLFDEAADFCEQFSGAFAGGEALHAGEVFASEFVEHAVRMHDIDRRQIVALGDLEVSLIVRGCDLEHAGPKGEIDMFVGDDREEFLIFDGERAADVLADEVGVALVLGIHGDGGVARDDLWAGGGDGEPGAGFLDHFDFEVVHDGVLRLHDDLFIAERGEGGRAPVHHAFATVDEAFFVEIDKHAHDAGVVVVVKGEALAAPVAGGAEFLELLDDDAAVLFLPLPDFGDEGFATKVVAVLDDALLLEGLFDDVLSGDAGVVGAGEPEDFFPEHAGAAGEDVLDGVVQDVAEGEDARHIWRRNDDGVGRAGLAHTSGVGFKAFVIQPALIPAGFDFRRRVGLVEFGHKGRPRWGKAAALQTPRRFRMEGLRVCGRSERFPKLNFGKEFTRRSAEA